MMRYDGGGNHQLGALQLEEHVYEMTAKEIQERLESITTGSRYLLMLRACKSRYYIFVVGGPLNPR